MLVGASWGLGGMHVSGYLMVSSKDDTCLGKLTGEVHVDEESDIIQMTMVQCNRT